MYNIKQKFSPR